MMLGLVGGLALGSVATLLALVMLRGPRQSHTAAGVRAQCGVSVLLFEAADAEGAIIDRATGGLGFSHCALDGCEIGDDGQALVIDCRPLLGVGRIPLNEYDGRRQVRIWLPLVEGRELYGCARSLVGQPYDALGLVVPKTGPIGGVVCSQLIVECLPASLRSRVTWPQRRPVAPNDLARAFGIAGPDSADVTV